MKRLKREDWFAAASAQHVWAMDWGCPQSRFGTDYDRHCRSRCGAPKIAFDALWNATDHNAGTLLWLPALRYDDRLSTTGMAWSLLSICATLGMGLLLFGEKVNRWNAAGIALAAIAMVLLQVKGA